MSAPTFGPLTHPYPETTRFLAHYYERGTLPPDIKSSPAAFRAGCERMLAHPDLPRAWREDITAILNTVAVRPTNARRVRA